MSTIVWYLVFTTFYGGVTVFPRTFLTPQECSYALSQAVEATKHDHADIHGACIKVDTSR